MTPFDNKKYKEKQKQEILERIKHFDKLYMEIGGKLFDDNHASRVLPGFDPNVKMQILKELSNELEIVFCINANDIISEKVRNDNGLTYAEELFRLIRCMNEEKLSVAGVNITFYKSHKLVKEFEKECKHQKIKFYRSYVIEDYPNDLNKIISKKGFGKNGYIKTTKKLILVCAPGANSGKLHTCLSQLYNDKVHGISSGYAKYETFPVWNLPLEHLVNVAYEISTVDIGDINEIDIFHEKAYGVKTVNYNRDIEAFPILSNILTAVCGKEIYKSPTEMGINNVGFAIKDDLAVQKASYEEIKRRYEKHKTKYYNRPEVLARNEEVMNKANKLYKKLVKNTKK